MGPDVAETAADGAPEFFSGAKPALQPNESLVQTFLSCAPSKALRIQSLALPSAAL